MTELAELEKRIAEAMERIRSGIEGLHTPPAEDMVPATEADALAGQLSSVSSDLTEATEALEAERARTAELEAALAEAQSENAALATQVAQAAPDMSQDLAATEAELRTLRSAMEELQTANAALRQAALTQVTEPELINRSLAADLEAVQAARLAELRDIDAILATLDPIIEGASHA